MTAFYLLGSLLLIVALGFVVVPLRQATANPKFTIALVITLPATAILCYLLFTNFDAELAARPSQVASIEEMVTRLEQRLQKEGGDADDWFMMGRSYVAMNRFADAVPAFARANELSGGADPGILVSYAEVLAITDPESLKTDAATLLDRVLTLSPMDPRGLWWGGLAALHQGNEALARQRWQTLLELDPPEVLAQAVERQLAMLSGQSTGTGAMLQTEAGEVAVPLRVTIDERLASGFDPATLLFVFARSPSGGGPPLAVSQHSAADLPLELSLGQQNVMLPGTQLAAHPKLRLVARLSLGGTPTAQSGDLYGEVDYEIGQDGVAELVINQVVE